MTDREISTQNVLRLASERAARMHGIGNRQKAFRDIAEVERVLKGPVDSQPALDRIADLLEHQVLPILQGTEENTRTQR